jgi:hypothetical protein
VDGKTIRLLSEYIAEHHRRERLKESVTYNPIYESAVTDTNGVEQDWEEKEDKS